MSGSVSRLGTIVTNLFAAVVFSSRLQLLISVSRFTTNTGKVSPASVKSGWRATNLPYPTRIPVSVCVAPSTVAMAGSVEFAGTTSYNIPFSLDGYIVGASKILLPVVPTKIAFPK